MAIMGLLGIVIFNDAAITDYKQHKQRARARLYTL